MCFSCKGTLHPILLLNLNHESFMPIGTASRIDAQLQSILPWRSKSTAAASCRARVIGYDLRETQSFAVFSQTESSDGVLLSISPAFLSSPLGIQPCHAILKSNHSNVPYTRSNTSSLVEAAMSLDGTIDAWPFPASLTRTLDCLTSWSSILLTSMEYPRNIPPFNKKTMGVRRNRERNPWDHGQLSSVL